mmetsp:Transcript_33336/g.107869  ORF Transcript_33336/g.107869 Transcript_33336/m.107869 type:complete len:133 (+) Transcript_33336:46-444(+)
MPETCVTKCCSCSHFQTVHQILPVSSNYYRCRRCHAYQPCVVYKTRDLVTLRSYNNYEMLDVAKRLNKEVEISRRINSLLHQKARVHELLARIMCDISEVRQLKPGPERLDKLQQVEKRLDREFRPRGVATS